MLRRRTFPDIDVCQSLLIQYLQVQSCSIPHLVVNIVETSAVVKRSVSYPKISREWPPPPSLPAEQDVHTLRDRGITDTDTKLG